MCAILLLLLSVVFLSHGWRLPSPSLRYRSQDTKALPHSNDDTSKTEQVNPLQALAILFLASNPAVAFSPLRFPVLTSRSEYMRCAGRRPSLLMMAEELRIAEDEKPYPVSEYKAYYGSEWKYYWERAEPYVGEAAVSKAFGETLAGEEEAVEQLLALQSNLKMMESIRALGTVRKTDDANEDSEAPCKYVTHWINLSTRPDRRARMEHQLKHLEMCATRFEALTGEDVKDPVIDHVWNTAFNAQFDKRQQPGSWHTIHHGERGCAGSHAALWYECVRENCPMLILEDDALLGPLDADFSTTVHHVMNHMADHDPSLVHLQTTIHEFGDYQGEVTPALRIRGVRYAWQTSGYIIWPATAAKLLRCLPMHEPVDNFLSRLAYNGDIRIYACDPPVIMQFSSTDGDIPHTGADEWSAVSPGQEPSDVK